VLSKRELIMTSQPILRFHTLAAVTILCGGLTLTACGSDSSDGPGDTAAVSGECKLGDTVDQPATTNGVPACADQPGVKTKTYPCHPPSDPGGDVGQGVWYKVVNTNGTVMYGKPGGKWVQAESAAGEPEEDLVQQIGC
jgi:hypothetical protein